MQRVLRQIPPAALAAITLPALVRHDDRLDLLDARLAAGLLAAAVAWRTKSAAWTLVVGMAALVIIDAL